MSGVKDLRFVFTCNEAYFANAVLKISASTSTVSPKTRTNEHLHIHLSHLQRFDPHLRLLVCLTTVHKFQLYINSNG